MTSKGDFKHRGVHTRAGGPFSKRTPVMTPLLSGMRCRWCAVWSVTVTAEIDGELAGWCTLAHAALDGLRLPSGRAPSSPGPRPRRAA